jgi:hypothetical protein
MPVGEKEYNFRIEIEDSIVVIICGEIETEALKKCLKTVEETKGTKKISESEEKE